MFGPYELSDNLGTIAGVFLPYKLSPQIASDQQRRHGLSTIAFVESKGPLWYQLLELASTRSKTPSVQYWV
jgi:hypothetical protein